MRVLKNLNPIRGFLKYADQEPFLWRGQGEAKPLLAPFCFNGAKNYFSHEKNILVYYLQRAF
jgi:hypothetical protein